MTTSKAVPDVVIPSEATCGVARDLSRNDSGLTLIEILIVLVLIATFTTLALPRLRSNLNLNLKKQARVLAGTIQFLYTQATVKNQIYRLHYDLDEHKYWIESSSSAEKFEIDKSVIKKPVQFEKKIRFKEVRASGKGEPITRGDAYTHFFPHGYAEKSAIKLQSETGQVFTIVVHPLTGRAKVYDRDLGTEE